MPYLIIAILSIPPPNANPVHFSESMPTALNTFGSTIPAPNSSSQPAFLQIAQPLPLHIMQATDTSALGSVKGKITWSQPYFYIISKSSLKIIQVLLLNS